MERVNIEEERQDERRIIHQGKCQDAEEGCKEVKETTNKKER